MPEGSAYASERIIGSGLRLGEINGMVGLENQNEYNCKDRKFGLGSNIGHSLFVGWVGHPYKQCCYAREYVH